jgi:hypothetical protein
MNIGGMPVGMQLMAIGHDLIQAFNPNTIMESWLPCHG